MFGLGLDIGNLICYNVYMRTCQSFKLPVRDDVTTVEYHRAPTPSEETFGYGATHYRTFQVTECTFPGTRILKKWFIADDDGLRYHY